MAFPTADKQKTFGSRFRQKKYDQHHPAEEGEMKTMKDDRHEAKESPEFEAGEQEGKTEANAEGGDMNPQSVVGTHGKAASVHVTHDHNANKHDVTSTHADGHVHKSSHMSPKDAHAAAGVLGGADSASEQQDMNPEDAMLGGSDQPESDGFRMPRLA